VVVGVNYLTETAQQRMDDPDQEFQIAAYALGDDYHDTLPPRLETLVEFIEQQVGKPIAHRIYTDTGPLLERDLAQRAGLGWIGKNTCLINPEKGSYFLLAEVLLDVDLEPDSPFDADRCGQCTRCIEACPTACILPDRTLDARRCLSYLTIELKDDVPDELRELIGPWLFGCDICQQVCPWNARFAMPTDDKTFQPSPWMKTADLQAFLELEPEAWRVGLKGSPLERPRRKGLVRNASLVAGNREDRSYLHGLLNVLQNDPEPLARRHAAWALGRIGDASTKRALQQARSAENDISVQDAIEAAMESLNNQI
jgi:epoxyqueuosine reductase